MATKQDPRKAGEKPPFPEQQQQFPGSDAALEPAADTASGRTRAAASWPAAPR